MHIGRSHPRNIYLMDNPTIEVTEQEKDLAVLINSNLKFRDQVASAVKKANKILDPVKQSLKYIDKEVIVLLYNSIIRNHLEYALLVWCPRTRQDLKYIERVEI